MFWVNEFGIGDNYGPEKPVLSTEQARMRRSIFRACAEEADGDLDAALSATDHLMSTQPVELLKRLADGYEHREGLQAALSVLDNALAEMQPMRSAALSILQ